MSWPTWSAAGRGAARNTSKSAVMQRFLSRIGGMDQFTQDLVDLPGFFRVEVLPAEKPFAVLGNGQLSLAGRKALGGVGARRWQGTQEFVSVDVQRGAFPMVRREQLEWP